jgi:hypothetical protein
MQRHEAGRELEIVLALIRQSRRSRRTRDRGRRQPEAAPREPDARPVNVPEPRNHRHKLNYRQLSVLDSARYSEISSRADGIGAKK